MSIRLFLTTIDGEEEQEEFEKDIDMIDLGNNELQNIDLTPLVLSDFLWMGTSSRVSTLLPENQGRSWSAILSP